MTENVLPADPDCMAVVARLETSADEQVPEWRDAASPGQTMNDQRAAGFLRTVRRLREFRATHGRLPSRHQNDGEFPHLGRKLNHFRKLDGVTPERLEILNHELPGWNAPLKRGPRDHPERECDRKVFLSVVERLVRFRQDHGFLPGMQDNDGGAPHLGRYLLGGKGRRRFNKERVEILDNALPEWSIADRMSLAKVEKFRETCDRMARFIDRHGRPPKVHETDETGEQHLGDWLFQHQRKNNLHPALQVLLDRVLLDGARQIDTTAEERDGSRFEALVDRLVTYRKEHGRLPPRQGNDGDQPHLGIALKQLRIRPQPAERCKLLDQRIPDWRTTEQPKDPCSTGQPRAPFEQTVQRYASFIQTHGRQPRQHETDELDHTQLGNWISNVRTGRIKLTPERIALLDAAYSEWRERDSVRGR